MPIVSTESRFIQAMKQGLGRFVARSGIHPNVLTFAGLAIVGIGAWMVVRGDYLWGGLVLFFGAGVDGVDGAVARLTGKASPTGAYLDSLADRYADFAVVLAMAAAVDDTVTWWIAFAALFGSITTSYAKAHLYEVQVPTDGFRNRAFMERQDRWLIALPAILTQHFAPAAWDMQPLVWGLALLAVLANLATLQRIIQAVRYLQRRG